MLEEKLKNRKPSLCGMIVVIIVRNLMCFFMFLIVIATIYMFYTLEDNKPSDFNFELSDNYVKAQEYVSKNKDYYLPGPIGTLTKKHAEEKKDAPVGGQETFLDMIDKATKEINTKFREYKS